MKKNILIIGNGFDLANGLPTTYKDFLKFCEYTSIIFERDDVDFNCTDTDTPLNYKKNFLETSDLNNDIQKQLSELAMKYRIIKSPKDNQVEKLDELYNCIKENTWYKYFDSILNSNKIGQTWIDFESEIESVVRELEKLIKHKQEGIPTVDIPILNHYNKFKEKEVVFEYIQFTSTRRNSSNIEIEEIYTLIDGLLSDLKELAHALEIYLSSFVSEIPTSGIKDFENISFDYILSFNYTDTFAKNYKQDEKSICYIHGKADKTASVTTCNLVLGIDEYLPPDKKDTELTFLAFKKFYQRIFNKTNNNYSIWLDEINSLGIYKNIYNEFELHIFGHSLDVTDKDILKDFILNNNVQTKIYYYCKDEDDKKDFSSKIKNLIKIIGQDELIARTNGGSKNTIEFIAQKL